MPDGMDDECQLIYELAEIACWSISPEGEIFWSDNLHDFYGEELGYDKKTVEDFKERVFPSDYPRFEAVINDAVSKHKPFAVKVRIRRLNSFKWVLIKGKANKDGSIVGCTQDIDLLYREAYKREQTLNTLSALIKSNSVDLEDLKIIV
jgi:hypothetical protein